MKSALGVFGGMFDPVHEGHIQAAHYAIRRLELEQLLIMPCGRPNHRAAAISSGEDRLNMLQLAFAGSDRIEISDHEIRSEAVSYSVDTLSWLKQQHSAEVLVFIVGMDAFNTLPAWQRWQELFSLCNLLLLSRAGLEMDPEVAVLADVATRQCTEPGELLQHDCGKLWLAEDFDLDISSTRVRQELEAGKQSGSLPADVLRYIKEHRLYGQA